MTYRCIGCGAAYGHKTGLSNHWRHCYGWKNYDRVTEHRRRRWEMRTLGPNLGHNLQVPSETPGPAQPNDMSLENTIEHNNDHEENPAGSLKRDPSPAAAPPQTSTRSGHNVRFPRRFDDYLPGMRTLTLAHIPTKENRTPDAPGPSLQHDTCPPVPQTPDAPGPSLQHDSSRLSNLSGGDTAAESIGGINILKRKRPAASNADRPKASARRKAARA